MEPNQNSSSVEPSLYNVDSSSKKINKLSDWPGAFGIYKFSKNAMMKNLKTIISLIVIEGLLTIVYLMIQTGSRNNLSAYYLIELIFILINSIFSGTIIYALIKSVRNEIVSVSESYSKVFSNSANVISVTILYGLISIVSILLFIVPAFFIIPRVYLSIYFVIDKDMGPTEAIRASWEATEGQVGKIYGILGVNLLILLPIITLIGVVVTIYFGFMYFAASAVLYTYLIDSKKSALKSI